MTSLTELQQNITVHLSCIIVENFHISVFNIHFTTGNTRDIARSMRTHICHRQYLCLEVLVGVIKGLQIK